jgi:hypothetical protein
MEMIYCKCEKRLVQRPAAAYDLVVAPWAAW